MTDQELAQAGERLYASIVTSQLTPLEMAGLAAAVQRRTQWSQLGPRLKVAVFRLIANAQSAEATAAAAQGSSGPAASATAESASPPAPAAGERLSTDSGDRGEPASDGGESEGDGDTKGREEPEVQHGPTDER